MGGLGKSSLAARLCDRLESRLQKIVWVGRLDKAEFLRGLGESLDTVEANQLLNQPGLSEPKRLERLLEEHLSTQPRSFVFDDFEQNVEVDDGGPRLQKDPNF